MIDLSEDDVLISCAALNEVCNGLPVFVLDDALRENIENLSSKVDFKGFQWDAIGDLELTTLRVALDCTVNKIDDFELQTRTGYFREDFLRLIEKIDAWLSRK